MARKRCTCSARKWDPDCEVHETRADWRQDDDLHEDEEAPKRRGESGGGSGRTWGFSTEVPWEELTPAQRKRAIREGFGPDEDDEDDAGKDDDAGKGGKDDDAGKDRTPKRRGYFAGADA